MLTETDPARVGDATHTSLNVDAPRARDFGDRLRELREARGLSGPRLARLANYSPGYIWELSVGRRSPTADTASRLDRLLQAGGELVALAVGGSPADAIGFVRTGNTWLRVRAIEDSSLVTLSLDALVGEVAALARVRDVVFTGQARAEIDLTGTQAAEVIRLLHEAVAVAYGKQDA